VRLPWLAALLLSFSTDAAGQETGDVGEGEPEAPPTRSLRIAPSAQILLFQPFEQTRRLGTGLFGAYEFILSPQFFLGINLSYRFFPGEERLHQLGYGLLMRHYLAGTASPDAVWMPFLEYGLLLQMHFHDAHDGTGTSHDTRLAIGNDLRIMGETIFVVPSWHFSRLSLFESAEYKMDYLELDIGYRIDW
jgi:hypothetical protein